MRENQTWTIQILNRYIAQEILFYIYIIFVVLSEVKLGSKIKKSGVNLEL